MRSVIITVFILIAIGEIASYAGYNAISAGTAICLLLILVSVYRDSKSIQYKSNETIAAEYKNERLGKFIKILLNKEIGPMYTPDGIDMIINCVNERINKEKLKFNNRTGLIIASIVSGICLPIVWKLFELYKMDEISWNYKIDLTIVFLAVLIYSIAFIIILYPYYMNHKLREYNDLYDMKSDLLYLKYLLTIDPTWGKEIIINTHIE